MFESVCLTKVIIIFQDLPIIKIIGIVGMIALAVAAVFSARILRRQEKS